MRLPRYFLARYPVTVGQWRVYYEAVRGGAWEPSRPDGTTPAVPDPRGIEGAATHPVVWVSWYDAMDYTRWLTAQVHAAGEPPGIARLLRDGDATSGGRSWVITLPSEAEWERAARGPTTAWRYPWGDAWDANRANWDRANSDDDDNTAVPTPSSVGGFPGGASPAPARGRRGKRCGSRMEEQSGNVWEWTRSLWGRDVRDVCVEAWPYPYQPDYACRAREDVRVGYEVDRVLRGGSFYDLWGSLRSACRSLNVPGTAATTSAFGWRCPRLLLNSDL